MLWVVLLTDSGTNGLIMFLQKLYTMIEHTSTDKPNFMLDEMNALYQLSASSCHCPNAFVVS